MLYEVVYDPVSGWKPCSIKARVAPGAGSGPPLRERFEVTDSVQGRWLRTGKMLVADRHKLDLTSVAFSVTPTAVLTSDELVQCQGQYQLQVTCFLDLPSALPGMGVAAPLDIPVAGLCQIHLALPVEIETKVERLSDDEAVLVFARPRFHLPTGPELYRTCLNSLRFQCQNPDLKLEPQPPQADWKVVRVTYQPGQASVASDMSLRIQGQAGYQVIAEQRLTLPFSLEGRLVVECRPRRLKVDGQDVVTAYATPIFRNPPTPFQLRKVLQSLHLSLDQAAAPWLQATPPALAEDSASWRISGRFVQGLLPPSARLTVTGQFGSEVVQESESLVLEADSDWQLCATNTVEVFYQKPGGWVFSDLLLRLARPEQAEPAQLNFSCGQPSLSDDQNLLQFEVQASGPGSWSVRVKLCPEVDLDAHPGTGWLETSGLLEVSVRVEQSGSQGKVFLAKASYQLRPRLELVVFDAAGQPDAPEGHTYEAADIDFAPLEFAADGVDSLKLGLMVVRSDQSPEDWLSQDYGDYLTFRPARFVGPGSDEFRCRTLSPKELEVQSIKPCLWSAARSGRSHLTLQLQGQLKPEAPVNLVREILKLEQALQPRYVDLKLWVVPSRKRGRSLAGVWAGLNRPDQPRPEPLPETEVELQVASPEKLLSLADPAVKELDAEGWQTFELVFSGLNRTNLDSDIKIRCRLKGDDQAVSFPINVKANGAQLFSALNQASGALELTNPEWERSASAAYWVDWLIPDRCRGVVYNARNFLAPAVLNEPLPPEWSKWVCGEYSERLTNWLLARRHGKQDPTQALAMNGLEVCQYTAAGFHDWCGLHLSGSDVNADPIFIDPWWEQSWGEGAAGYGWAQQEIRMVASLTFLVIESVTIAVFISRSLARQALRLARWAAEKTLPEVFFVLKERVIVWVADLSSGRLGVKPNTVRAVVAAATTLGAYLYQRFFIGASCQRATCFDDQFDYTYYDERALLRRLSESLPNSSPSKCEAW